VRRPWLTAQLVRAEVADHSASAAHGHFTCAAGSLYSLKHATAGVSNLPLAGNGPLASVREDRSLDEELQ
jgi:hypothetical protein